MSEFENKNGENNENIENIENVEMPESADTQIDEDAVQEPISQKIFKEIISWIACILIAVVASMIIRNYVFTVVKVEGDSMNPTLITHERLFAGILGYTPDRGDIVILNPKGNKDIAYIKRIIATEGDRIWIDELTGDVHLKKSGSDEWEILDEDYIKEKSRFAGIAQKFADDSGEGLLIEKDHVFVMGDNRNNSRDSRDGTGVGQVHKDDVIGKASLRWWPLSEFGFVK